MYKQTNPKIRKVAKAFLISSFVSMALCFLFICCNNIAPKWFVTCNAIYFFISYNISNVVLLMEDRKDFEDWLKKDI